MSLGSFKNARSDSSSSGKVLYTYTRDSDDKRKMSTKNKIPFRVLPLSDVLFDFSNPQLWIEVQTVSLFMLFIL